MACGRPVGDNKRIETRVWHFGGAEAELAGVAVEALFVRETGRVDGKLVRMSGDEYFWALDREEVMSDLDLGLCNGNRLGAVDKGDVHTRFVVFFAGRT